MVGSVARQRAISSSILLRFLGSIVVLEEPQCVSHVRADVEEDLEHQLDVVALHRRRVATSRAERKVSETGARLGRTVAQVHVSRRLLDDDDGPMLDVLKGFHGARIETPTKKLWRPDPERLAIRFERFQTTA
jgi:hypothetical protein